MQIYYNTIDYLAYAYIISLWFLTSSLQLLISFTSSTPSSPYILSGNN